jgi:hypothetical protein
MVYTALHALAPAVNIISQVAAKAGPVRVARSRSNRRIARRPRPGSVPVPRSRPLSRFNSHLPASSASSMAGNFGREHSEPPVAPANVAI